MSQVLHRDAHHSRSFRHPPEALFFDLLCDIIYRHYFTFENLLVVMYPNLPDSHEKDPIYYLFPQSRHNSPQTGLLGLESQSELDAGC
ncbi:hypothetical protein Hanom_Chr10g00887731 [Helianthus anomalus]